MFAPDIGQSIAMRLWGGARNTVAQKMREHQGGGVSALATVPTSLEDRQQQPEIDVGLDRAVAQLRKAVLQPQRFI